MTIELRVLTGARAGHRTTHAGPVVTIGRHPANDLPLDTHGDLEASARHAELRLAPDGTVTLADLGSTNGTFVAGERITTRTLADGDVVQLGGDGPRIEVRFGRPAGEARPGGDQSAGEAPPAAARTRRRRAGYASVAFGMLLLTAGLAYVAGARRSAREMAELRALVAAQDSVTRAMQAELRGLSDSSVLASLRLLNDSLRRVVQAGSPAARAEAREDMARWRDGAAAVAALDLAGINARNAPAVAYLVSDLGDRVVAGTAFAISPDGALLTNRHLVRAEDGAPASRIAVKFRGEREWRRARLVRVAPGADDDLALLRLDDVATVPAVQGIAADDTGLREGAPIVSIGYPLGLETPMEGSAGDAFVARTSLYPGTVSKMLPNVVQLAAWAGHGSSGSPILEPGGLVVGVVWGGPREGNGRLVYAVPASRVAAFLRGDG